MLNEFTFEKLIEMSTEIGIKTAMEKLEKERMKRFKDRYDRRLRNTKLLMKNYKRFITHYKESEYSKTYNVIDLLEGLEDLEQTNTITLESLKESCARTAALVEHINKMIDIYKIDAKRKKGKTLRQFKVLKMLYIDEEEKTFEDIARILFVDEKTVQRDRDCAIAVMTSLLFGVDGLKME